MIIVFKGADRFRWDLLCDNLDMMGDTTIRKSSTFLFQQKEINMENKESIKDVMIRLGIDNSSLTSESTCPMNVFSDFDTLEGGCPIRRKFVFENGSYSNLTLRCAICTMDKNDA